jgi:geranylgeranylglycerol-phosphate geranylgeranyltransferase
MTPYIKILRPGNCMLACIGVIVGALIAKGNGVLDIGNIPSMALACAVVFLSTAGGNVLNDYTDRDVDKINHPERPIPSGKIRPESAKMYAVALFALAFPPALLSTYWYTLTAILCIAILLMLAYEFKYKAEGLPGNVIISVLSAMVFVFGGCAAGNPVLTIPFAIISFFGSLYREIVKDIEDVEGDFTRCTLPKKVGKKNAGYIALAVLGMAILLSPLPLLLPDFMFWPKTLYAIGIALSDIVFIYSALFTLKQPTKSQKLAKHGMLIATLAFLIIGIR